MTPGKIRKETLKELRATRKSMTSAAWLLSIQKQPIEVRRDAALKLLDVEQAILALGNATLSDIRDQLVENEVELLKGRQRLEKARVRLTRVKGVLKAVGDFLAVVGKAVKFVASSGIL